MKVKIGNYINRWTSTSFDHFVQDHIFHDPYMMKLEEYENTRKYKFLDKISDGLQWIFNHTINLYLDRKKRKIEIHIDNYDVWGLDHTLALIIVPALELLKEQKHGTPYIDKEDIPEGIKIEEDEAGAFSDESWDYIMDQMIWSFKELIDDDEQEEFIYDKKMPMEEKLKLLKEREERIKKGTMLFGKYYRALWD